MTEKEKMLAGKVYDSLNRELALERKTSKAHLQGYNKTLDSENFRRQRFLRRLLGRIGANSNIEPTIYFEYGTNSYIGENFMCGKGFTVLDMGRVTIGDNCFFGTDVSISTQIRSFHSDERLIRVKSNKTYAIFEYARPVKIGNNVWLGNNVVLNPGSSVGDGAVIMSGSVVTGAIAPNSIAAGFPCKVLREVVESDRILGELEDDFDEYVAVSETGDSTSDMQGMDDGEVDVDDADDVASESQGADVEDFGVDGVIGGVDDVSIIEPLAAVEEAGGVSSAADLSRQIDSEGIANQFNEKMFSFKDVK